MDTLRLRWVLLTLLLCFVVCSIVLVSKNEQAYRQFELSFFKIPDWFTPTPTIDKVKSVLKKLYFLNFLVHMGQAEND